MTRLKRLLNSYKIITEGGYIIKKVIFVIHALKTINQDLYVKRGNNMDLFILAVLDSIQNDYFDEIKIGETWVNDVNVYL